MKTLLSWTAPGRPFRKKGREYYASIVLIVILVDIVLFMFGQYSLMLVVIALAFLSIALSTIPPRDFHYKISNHGLKVEDHFYIWEELYDFYFKRIEGEDIVVVGTRALIPGELKITLGSISREHIKNILARYLPYREYVRPTFVERSGDWLARNFPLEKKPRQK